MLKKVKYIFYLLSVFVFIFSITNFYFSSQNIRETNKSRSIYSVELSKDIAGIPLLKNDTKDFIEYRNDIEVYKKKKKKYEFWKLLKRN